MGLDKDTTKRYRAIGHKLKPVVTVADNGLSPNVLKEIQNRLHDHELIKVKLDIDDRDLRKNTIEELAGLSGVEIVQTIGKLALLFKPAEEPNPKLSNLLRVVG